MTYTKGEWKAYKTATGYSVHVEVVIRGRPDEVCEVYSCHTGLARDNAHLIAAAPDLYEALELVYSEPERFTSSELAKIGKALAKAEVK